MVVKGLLSGQQAWLMQRLSALYLGLYLLGFGLVLWWAGGPLDYPQWQALLTHTWLWLATGLAFLALLLHAWIGMRDVILDYVKPLPLRFAVLAAMGVGLLACGLWALKVLLMAVML